MTWPGTDPRHDLRELVRLTPLEKLVELREAWQKTVKLPKPKAKARRRV